MARKEAGEVSWCPDVVCAALREQGATASWPEVVKLLDTPSFQCASPEAFDLFLRTGSAYARGDCDGNRVSLRAIGGVAVGTVQPRFDTSRRGPGNRSLKTN